jgi:hypothetical protein
MINTQVGIKISKKRKIEKNGKIATKSYSKKNIIFLKIKLDIFSTKEYKK